MSAREWKPGDRAYIEVEVSGVLDGTAYVWIDRGVRKSTSVPATDLLPVPEPDEADGLAEDAITDEIHNRLHEFVSWVEDTDDASGYHVLSDVPVSEVALVARRALAAANLLASPVQPGRSEAVVGTVLSSHTI